MRPGPPSAAAQPISAQSPWARPLRHPSLQARGARLGPGAGPAAGMRRVVRGKKLGRKGA